MMAADDIHEHFYCFSKKIRLDVSSESSARQRIHVKNKALFYSKDKSKKLKCRLLQILFGAFRVNSACTSFINQIKCSTLSISNSGISKPSYIKE